MTAKELIIVCERISNCFYNQQTHVVVKQFNDPKRNLELIVLFFPKTLLVLLRNLLTGSMRVLQLKLKWGSKVFIPKLICKAIFIGLFITFPINLLLSQIPVYVQGKQYISDSYMEGIDIYTTPNGTVFNTGNFSGSVDFNPDIVGAELKTSLGYSDIYLTKTNADGSLDWVKNFGGQSNDIVKAMFVSDDYIYLVGVFSDTADVNPSEDVYNLVSNGKEDGFILKLSYQGTLLSASRLGGSENDAIYSIMADSVDNIFVSGYFSNSTDFDLLQSGQARTAIGLKDMFIAKYQSTGQLEYATTIGSVGNESLKSTYLKEDGSIYVSGIFNKQMAVTTQSGLTVLDTKGSTDVLMAHIGTTGEINWIKSYGGKKSDEVSSIIGLNDVIYLSGSFSDSVNFSDELNPVIKVSQGASDTYLLQLDTNGIFKKVITGGSVLTDKTTDLIFDGNKGLITTGYFQDLYTLNTLASTITLASKGLIDPFQLLFDTTLNFIGGGSSGSASNDFYNQIYIDNYHQLFVTGVTGSYFDRDLTLAENNISGTSTFNIINTQYKNCIPSSKPTIVGPSYSVCPVEQFTLNLVNDNLNDALYWRWSKGSCNGTVIGTGDSLVLQQNVTTTYFVNGAGGCVSNALCDSFIVTSTGCFKVSGEANKIDCFGGNTILKAIPKNGVAPFLFSLDNINFSSDSSFTVQAGTYTIYSRDAVGRMVRSSPINISQPQQLGIAGVCYSPVEKYLGVLAFGGTKPYQFSRNSIDYYNGIQRGKTAYVFSPVRSGIYTITVRDSRNCEVVLEINTDTLPICPEALLSTNLTDTKDKKSALSTKQFSTLSPNPFRDYFEIFMTGGNLKIISAIDAQGNLIYLEKTKDNKIKMGSGWAAGFYIIRIIENNQIHQHKVIKL